MHDRNNREVINEDFNDMDAAVRRAKSLHENAGDLFSRITVYETKMIESVKLVSSWRPELTLKKETTL